MKQRKGMRLGTYNAETPEILPVISEAREKFLKDEATRMEQARRNGEKIGRALTAKKMLERGMDISVISDVTGLSEEEVRTL